VPTTLSQYIASRSGVGMGGNWSKTVRSETDMLPWAPCRRPARSCGFEVIVETCLPRAASPELCYLGNDIVGGGEGTGVVPAP
jgi:hypothetical protein